MAEPTPPPTNPALAIVSQARALWQRVPARARFGAIAAVIGILGLVGFLALRPGPPPWKPVGGQLAPGDANELVTVLNGQGIPNRLTKGGRGVEVPASDLAAATVAAASVGLPRHGEGSETLKDLGPFPTDRAEKEKFRRALEGELARSIASLTPVETARVHIAFGRQSMIKELEEPPTASVQVHLRAGQALAPAQVAGVKNLVAAAVDGLTAERVVVVDQHGEVLSADDHGSGDDLASTERDVAAKVRAILEKSVGAGNVEVAVHAEIDRSKTSTTEDRYDPAGNVITSESRTVDGPGAQGAGSTVVQGVAGATANLQGTTGTTTTATAAPPRQVISETKAYANSHTVTQTEAAPARLARLHVAVLVNYKTPADGGDPVPPTKAELEAYTELVRSTAGIDADRGDQLEIRALPFAPEEPLAAPRTVKPKLPVPLPLAAAGAAALIGIVVGVLALRRREAAAAEVAPLLALPAPIAEVERALEPGAAAAAAPGLPAPTEKSLEERVLAAVKTDLPRAARVLASWLGEPDPVSTPAKGGKA